MGKDKKKVKPSADVHFDKKSGTGSVIVVDLFRN